MNKFLISVLSLALGFGGVAHAQTCNPLVPATAPDSRFEVVAGTNGQQVRDRQTNLIWQRCLIGQSWNGSTCSGTASQLSWTDALKNARQYSGSISWRLANIKELQSLVEEQCENLAFNTRVFPGLASGSLWSSTPVWGSAFREGNSSTLEYGAWNLMTDTGAVEPDRMSVLKAGWAVRSRN